jgi:aspartyl-tRNA(Asn)/glutamyl-tRNA(Gln) amidotransferase subunit A
MCDWAIGSDTGGSIRVPAALCGVVGFKPTLGAISTEAVIPLSATLDTLGPLAPDVRSAARALEMMMGRTGLAPSLVRELAELQLGTPAGWSSGLDEPTARAWREASGGLPEVPFPDRSELARPGATILFYEAFQYHRPWFEAHPEKYGADLQAHFRQGSQIDQHQYAEALEARRRVSREAEEALAGLDALLLPTTAVVAPLIGDEEVREPLTRFTRPFNTTGHPVVSLPYPGTGLPVGIQVVGHLGREDRLLEVALALESTWKSRAGN